MSLLQAVKLWPVQHVDLAKDALHVYVGLGLFLGSALLFRWNLRSWKPLAVVLAVALTGEGWDLRDSIVYHTPIHLWGNWKDLWNTMFWPTSLMVLARTTRLFSQRP
ncbi:hypothetical protein [Sphingomonas hengshuiensis]|uniref:Uncharacterized protein n=1 Tax=Sphingomonas hengshuiensis TaxID=1609977 RepID=A0A7U4J7I9_9SPHN|nr:hypothetical protein [Sphingomonas hengshuiensis]AJP71686.1 hypothetical protein TS85_07665 [Sphingomonas hengshuiensis]